MSENVSHEIRVLIIAGDIPDPHFRQRAQWDTFEEVVDTEGEDNDGSETIDPGDLQEYVRDELEVLATCMDNGENDAPIPGVDNSQLETACSRRGALDSSRHSRASPGSKSRLTLAELPLPSFKQPREEPQT